MSQERRTLCGLLMGNVLYAAVICIIGAFLVDNKLSFVLGTLWSTLGACLVTMHMYFSLQKSLDMDSESAEKRENTQAIFRMIIMIVVVTSGLLLSEYFHPLGIVFGAFALKASAYCGHFFININKR